MDNGILLLRASGGMANRLQAVAAGVAYCLLSGRRLCVDWRDGVYSDDSSNVFPLWFNLRGIESASVEEAVTAADNSLYPSFWRSWLKEPVAVEYLFNNNHMSPENVARTSIDFSRFDYEQEVLVGWGWNMAPALALAPLLREKFADGFGKDDRETLRVLFKDYIVLDRGLEEVVDEFSSAHFSPGRTVGAHIRHTDLKAPLEGMIKAIRDVTVPSDTVFLATDNILVQKSVERIFARVVHTEKVFPEAGETLHGYTPGISRVQSGREALVDMYLLARCDAVVHFSRSSFARIPAIMSGLAPDRIKIVYG